MSDIDRGDDRPDDRLDELLRSAARDYNRPPETPRELMWGRIEAKREAGRGARGAGVIPIRPRAHYHWVRWAVGIAAALVLGFGLGRWRGADGGGAVAHGGTAEPPSVAVRPAPSVTPPAADSGATPAESSTTAAPKSPAFEPPAPREQRVARREVPDEPHGSGEPRPGPSAGCRVPSAECRVPNTAYTLAAIQHLTQAEALLTSFRAEARSGKQVDAQLSAWAKDLLVSTRLMLDSPAGRDPRMRQLLEDLELVLAQIAQLSTQRAGDELNLIDQAVEGRNVLPRLRTTIPAGVRPAGS
jgi:hypothetical protein